MRVFLDCTHTHQTDTNTGIQRVVRNIVAQASRQRERRRVSFVPVAFQDREFRRPRSTQQHVWKDRYRGSLGTTRRVLHRLTRPLHGVPGFKPLGRAVKKAAKWALLGPAEWLERYADRPMAMARGDLLVLLDASWNAPDGWWEAVGAAKASGVRIVPVVYDLIPLTHPRTLPWWLVGQFKAWLQRSLDTADGFLCISEATRAELLRELTRRGRQQQWSAERIRSFPLGVGLDGAIRGAPIRPEVQALAEREARAWPYLMVGTFEPRKNHAFVLDAFEAVWQHVPGTELWLVGAHGWQTERLIERLAEHPERGKRLKVFHDLTDAELDFVYRRAKATIAASTVEGYGLPVGEALARGCVVLASDIPAFREVAGGHARYFSLDSLGPLITHIEALEAEGAAQRVLGFQGMDWRSATARFVQEAVDLADGLAAKTAPPARTDEATAKIAALEHRVRELEQLLAARGPAIPSTAPATNGAAPRVSVIMPVYNRPVTVVEAIRSVQAQRFEAWELIVVDDGSTDSTAAAVEPLLSDPRIRLLRQENAGPAGARNTALQHARGNLVAYLDSDNLWYPDYLARAVPAFDADVAVLSAYSILESDQHGWISPGGRVDEAYDRERMINGEFIIDLNVFMHRRELYERLGGFDPALKRVDDWDLVLRYTEHSPPLRLGIVAARYRRVDDQAVTLRYAYGPERLHVRSKWLRPTPLARPLRVLYVLCDYPQLSETYVETEIRRMQRWGVHIEVWAKVAGAGPAEASAPVHRGRLSDAIRVVRPDVIHVHWIDIAMLHGAELTASGIPVTVRPHGFEVSPADLNKLLAQPFLQHMFCFPHMLKALSDTASVEPVVSGFDLALFKPQPNKDRRLVVRAAAGLPDKDFELFIDVAKRLQGEFRFVLALAWVGGSEGYVLDIAQQWRTAGLEGEVLMNVPHKDFAAIVAQAGIYLHTVVPPGRPHGLPLGMPIGIFEAMGTGAHVLVPDVEPLVGYVGNAGCAYRDAEHAAQLIAETANWSDAQWHRAWQHSVDLAYVQHADEVALRPIYDTWCAIAAEGDAAKPLPALAGG